MGSKPFWQSKTFYLNLALIVTLVVAEGTNLGIPVKYIAFGGALANIINRFFTDKSVTLS